MPTHDPTQAPTFFHSLRNKLRSLVPRFRHSTLPFVLASFKLHQPLPSSSLLLFISLQLFCGFVIDQAIHLWVAIFSEK
ncbi:unnamed protein product [Lactuca virosa]|uniref:Uncharacterized protein n=1 Tax=Lactuca virosa TaxID=75947 RepID=A0AAU9P2G7_9ASTR|nr:unnamed protein product [Lactuca virosa]